jgi:hypothetical protein
MPPLPCVKTSLSGLMTDGFPVIRRVTLDMGCAVRVFVRPFRMRLLARL